MNINQDLIKQILSIKAKEIDKKYKNKIKELLNQYNKKDIKEIYVFYYYGRSFIDGSISKTTSFKDMVDFHKNDTLDEILRKLCNTQYCALKQSWETANDRFNEHENNVQKELFEKRLKSYNKPNGHNFFKFNELPDKKSSNKVFEDIFKEFNLMDTTDINIAKSIIDKVILETNGSIIVDFLGSENFDYLDYVENDDEMLKLYWKYSNGNNKYPLPPHNIRVDIAFEKLELIKYSNTNVAIALKGFYRNKNEIKQYYHNKEKIKKIYEFFEIKWSLFYNELNFDKKHRGASENFQVTFLPWRYYNILILPKENLPSVGDTSKILILKNLLDIKNLLSKTFNEFYKKFEDDEDFITMYGNRYRKILEKLLKFILLASKIMFKENYEKDMIGKLLEQMKYEITKEEDYLNNYNKLNLNNIVQKIEDEGLLKKLHLCSHDNVKHNIDKKIVEEIHNKISQILEESYKYFQLQV